MIYTTLRSPDTARSVHLSALLVIAIVCIIIYSNSLKTPFVFDDVPNIVTNKTIRNLSNFTSPGKVLSPRAIVDFTFALNYKFSKLKPQGYHLTNILIHTINGFLVYFMVLSILQTIPAYSDSTGSSSLKKPLLSIITALIFVAHPIQTQAVTYTVQRYASMASLFYIGSLLFYLQARLKQRALISEKGSAAYRKNSYLFNISVLYILTITFGMLAFLSKQNTASLPLAILLIEFLLINRTASNLKKTWPLLCTAFGLWTLFILYVSGIFAGSEEGLGLLEDVSNLTKETITVSRWEYLNTQFNVLVIYIRLLLFPVGQSIDYQYSFKSGFFDAYTPMAFLFLVGLVIIGISIRKKQLLITFGIFWFFITLSVESSIIPIRDALFEHRLYLAMFGFALIAGHLLFYFLSKRQMLLIIVSTVIILTFSTATYIRNTVWRSEVSLWQNAVNKSPQKARPHYNLGVFLDKQHRTEEAIQHYLQAIQIKPDYAEAHVNLGNALNKQKKTKKAIAHYSQAIRIKPDFAEAYSNLGNVLESMGKTEKAIANYSKALKINPDFEKAHYNLGTILDKQGRTEEAIEHYLKALKIRADYIEAHNNLGNALKKQGDIPGAIQHYSKALHLDPDFEKAHYNLGTAYRDMGNLDKAIDHFKKAVQINPDYEDAYINIGIILTNQEKPVEAIKHLNKALQINPENPDINNYLGVALRKTGDFSAAIRHFQIATQKNPDCSKAYYNLGTLYKNLGNFDAAVSNLKNAIAINPGSILSHYQLGVTFNEAGNYALAASHFANVLQIDPDDREAHINLGVALTHQGRLNDAVFHFKEALRIQPKDAVAHGNIGSVLARQGHLKQAIAHFEEALRIKPGYIEARENLKRALKLQKSSTEPS